MRYIKFFIKTIVKTVDLLIAVLSIPLLLLMLWLLCQWEDFVDEEAAAKDKNANN